MPYEITKVPFSGSIKEVELGKGKRALKVGGGNAYSFHTFEGAFPNRPKIAMEIWDMMPDDWAEAALAPFKDVAGNPVAWAKKCVEEYGADMIVVQMKSTDPNGTNRGADEAAADVKKIVDAVDVPVVVWGVANAEKDADVLKKVAEVCDGKHIALGPVEEKNHKQIGAAALGYKHTVIASSPIDVNLAKQVNILLENLGVKNDLIIDPTTGGLGYGLEYSYSVMERLRMAGLIQQDDKLQFPIICNLGNEVWKSKEAKLGKEEAPNMGDPALRGYMMEAVGAVAYLMAGVDILIMRHPESIKLIRKFIDLMFDGGAAFTQDAMAEKIAKMKEMPQILGIDVKFERKAVEAVAVKPAAAPKKEETKPAPALKVAPAPEKKEKPAAEKAPAPEMEKAAAPKAVKEDAEKIAAEKAAKEQAAMEAAAKEAAERAAKDAAAKVAAQKAAAEKAAKEAAEQAAAEKAAAKETLKKEEEARKAARLAEKEKRMAGAVHHAEKGVTMTPAEIQLTEMQKLILMIDRVHKRN